MARLQVRTYQQILQRMAARAVARSGLSDLLSSSSLMHILGAVAREVDDIYFQLTRLERIFSIDTAQGDDLIERAQDIQPGQLTLQRAAYARGELVFSRATNTGVTLVIPRYTVVQTVDGIQVRSEEEAIILASSVEQISGHGIGRDSAPVSATAVSPGAQGNIAVSTATVFVAQPTGTSEVTNTIAFAGGRDVESSDEFRARLKAYVASLARSQRSAIESALLGLADPTPLSTKTVAFVRAINDPLELGSALVYVDDGLGTAATRQTITDENICAGISGPTYNDTAVGGEQYLALNHIAIDGLTSGPPTLVSRTGDPAGTNSALRGTLTADTHYKLNPATGELYFDPPLVAGEYVLATYDYYDGLLGEVQKVLNGDAADPTNYPGLSALGTRAVALSPTAVPVRVSAVISTTERSDLTTVRALAQSAVLSYINTAGISSDIVVAEIIERIMGVPGVTNVRVLAPAADVAILDDQIARSSAGDVVIL